MAPAPNEADVEWRTAGGLQTVSFFTVSPQPDDSASIWAGSWGNNIGVSDNGGKTLQPLHNGLETLSVLAILRHLAPGQFTVGTIEGLFRSDDGGTSWFKLPGDLAQQTVYALHQSQNGSIFAGAADGLWESADYGASWQPVLGLPPATVIRLGEVMVEGEPLIWAGTEDSGVWLSSDEGRTWRFGGLAGRSVYALVVDLNGESIVAATDQGLRMGTLTSAR
jgi:ligand-binding sensor domain-containing protein